MLWILLTLLNDSRLDDAFKSIVLDSYIYKIKKLKFVNITNNKNISNGRQYLQRKWYIYLAP